MRLFQQFLGRVLLGATLSFLSFQGFAINLPKGVSEVTQVEGITEYRLDNGLRVLFAPDESKPTTTVNMTYLVGSRHENYGQTGMAHLLEHMLFKGTPRLATHWVSFPNGACAPMDRPRQIAPTILRPSRPTRKTSNGFWAGRLMPW